MSVDPPISLPTRIARSVAEFLSARPGKPRPLAEAECILVVKLDALGDFVLATPFLRSLRRAAPKAHIAVCTRSLAAPLAQACTFVDSAFVLPVAAGPRPFGDLRHLLETSRSLRSALRSRRPDFAFVARSGPDVHRGRLVAKLSGATCRIGFSSSTQDPVAGANALTTTVVYPPLPLPEAEALLLLLRQAGHPDAPSGPLEVHHRPDDAAAVARRLRSEGVGQLEPLFVFGVGASLPHKIWPERNFLGLAEELLRLHPSATIVLIGDSADRDRFPPSSGRILNWCGQLTPLESHALLNGTRLFVGNDSGAMHLAAAAGCPVVVATWDSAAIVPDDVNSHARFAPHGVPYRLVHPTTRSQHREASGVAVTNVMKACSDLLAESAPAAPRTGVVR